MCRVSYNYFSCGDIAIEYPFGISSGCYYPGDDSFNLTCKEDRPHVLGDTEVENFNHSGELQVLLHRSSTCYDAQENEINSENSDFTLDNFTLSAKNKFTLIGCNALALLGAFGMKNYTTGCISTCNSPPEVNGKCNGAGFCRSRWIDIHLELFQVAYRTRLP
ncbi:Wall-associated receptor kinase 1 [Cardamine amara subsp. amara]|uniref:Wall-associated receptor kinase 1 n=1 Tax=Cardamine amara subsp. amara TaxID=228776 RepID=A0ABD1AS80_CARAN